MTAATMKKPSAKRYGVTNRMTFGRAIIYVLLTMMGFVMLYPMWYVLCVSFSNNVAMSGKGMIFWPVEFNLDAYRYVLGTPDLINIYGNTLYVMVFGVLLSMALTVCASYGLARKPKGYKIATYFFLIPMLFSGGTIPAYLNMRSFGLLNNLWSLVLCAAFSTYNCFILRNFFASIPESLMEAAEIEGAGTITTLVKIVLPLSMAGIATIALFYGVGYWNMYFSALIYCNKRVNWVLQVFLKEVLISSSADIMGGGADNAAGMKTSSRTVQMAVVFVSVVPVLCIYPFIQRYFVKGVMVGAVKG